MKPLHYILMFFILLSIGLGAWVQCERNKNTELTMKDDKAKIKANSDTIWSNNDSTRTKAKKTADSALFELNAAKTDVARWKKIATANQQSINNRPNDKDYPTRDAYIDSVFRYITRK